VLHFQQHDSKPEPQTHSKQDQVEVKPDRHLQLYRTAPQP
jgi:hypothetical protein